MQINWKIVSGVLAFIVTYDEVAMLRNRKTFASLREKSKRQQMRIDYLSTVLDMNDIPMNDFDKIALQTIKEM